MIRIAQADIKRIFGKAEESEIPAQVELGSYDFYHWRSETTPKLYLVYRQGDLVRGIAGRDPGQDLQTGRVDDRQPALSLTHHQKNWPARRGGACAGYPARRHEQS